VRLAAKAEITDERDRYRRGIRLLVLASDTCHSPQHTKPSDHSHKVSGSMGSRYRVVVRGTLLARDFYTSGRK
jgi:hypothetical protein